MAHIQSFWVVHGLLFLVLPVENPSGTGINLNIPMFSLELELHMMYSCARVADRENMAGQYYA